MSGFLADESEKGRLSARDSCMTKSLEAIYQGGVLRPVEPLDLKENQRVRVTVTDSTEEDLLDTDYILYCEENADYSVTLEEVRQALSKIPGSMTEDFIRLVAVKRVCVTHCLV